MTGLQKPISELKGVGERRSQLFHKLGVGDLDALLHYYPRDYEDWSAITPIAAAPFGEDCCVKARVERPVAEHHIRRGMTIYKTTAADHSGRMQITLFNNKYAAARLRSGEEYLFYGKLTGGFTRRECASPQIGSVGGAVIRPIYPATEGLSSRMIEGAVKSTLSELKEELPDLLPAFVREEQGLCGMDAAIRHIHFPPSFEALREARDRLVFEEFFHMSLGLSYLREAGRKKASYRLRDDHTGEFFSALPFSPTGAQRRAVAEGIAGLKGSCPMNRLVQGDVGSGKTVVAAALCHSLAKNGLQSAVMTPTEILAQQHYRSISKMIGGTGIQLALLTGSTPAKEKKRIIDLASAGHIDILIGTHALLEDEVRFKNLALAVTDEQHRFGVAQRTALAAKAENPHILVMSATPIPRTLALIVYGDLDISILDEMPPGRRKKSTYAVDTSYRDRVYRFVKKHLDEGRQGYIVCPLVEEEESDLSKSPASIKDEYPANCRSRPVHISSAVAYQEKLRKGAFKGYRLGLLHGRMKPAEKDAVMGAFSAGEIQLLVSTTVIEVGVDVPNAVIMVIENAERFGLSQLHQLRGRIGRGAYDSTCVLISDTVNEKTKKRLQIMCDTDDGFKIADEDLKLRGPGDFFGRRQHGLPDFKIANLYGDMPLLKKASEASAETLRRDPGLRENVPLREHIRTLFGDMAAKGMN